MNFTEEEKKVFEINEKGYFDPAYYFEKHLLNMYVISDNEEEKKNLRVTLNFLKKMIIELSKKRGYNIVGDECYDVDALLNSIIDIPTESEDKMLANFNPLLYKNSEKLEEYFYSLTKDLSWEDLKYLAESFSWINDDFRSFFANHFEKLISIALVLYNTLNISDKQSSFPSISTNKIDDDWKEEENIEETELNPSLFEEYDFNDEWENEVKNDNKSYTIELNKETLINLIKYINVIDQLIKYRNLGFDIINKLHKLAVQKKLDYFYSDDEFVSMFDLIMEHDKTRCSYYFHGTQCLEDAQTIIEEGLGMMREDLKTTSYREFTKDEVILYERGIGGEIGREAIVIIEVPKNSSGEELNVVTQLDNKTKIHFSPSGLQGLNGKPNYIVLPENIVGYIDKKNKQIVFNPKYRNYEQIINNKKKR